MAWQQQMFPQPARSWARLGANQSNLLQGMACLGSGKPTCRKCQHRLDAFPENSPCIAVRPTSGRFIPNHAGRIRHTPMRRDGRAEPDRTRFARGVITDSDHEIHGGRAFLDKFIPGLAAKTFSGIAETGCKLRSQRLDPSRRMAARTECF